MTLADITLPLSYDECKVLALLFGSEAAAEWYAIQQEHGDPRHVAGGQQLTDGRWMLRGDVLSELYPGGILGWAVEYLTPEIMSQIEVLPMSEVVALLPPEPPSPVI